MAVSLEALASDDAECEVKTHALFTLRDLAQCAPDAFAPHAAIALPRILDALVAGDAAGGVGASAGSSEVSLSAGDALEGVVDALPPTAAMRALSPHVGGGGAAPVRCLVGVIGRMEPETLKRLVTVSKGVDATAWPDNTHLVEYAVKDIRTLAAQHGNVLAELPWVQIIELSKQTQDGRLPVEWRRLAHHVGCMYAHLFQWQLVKEQKLKKALIFESDGVQQTDLPFAEAQQAIDRLPEDADLLLFSFGNTPGGDLVDQWKGHGDDGTPVDVHLYKWNKWNAVAGLQSYVITDNFVRKVQEYISHKGADMIDAWLLGKMCVVGKDKDWNMRGLGETQFMPPGSKPILNCYHATTWS